MAASAPSQADHPRPASIATLDTYLQELGATRPEVDAGLRWIVATIASAGRRISNQLKRARLEDVLGEVGQHNVQGEAQQKLDVIANEILKDVLRAHPSVAIIGSEEDDELLVTPTPTPAPQPRYAVLFDPLDGSSNLDVAGGVGTIFSVYAVEASDVTRLRAGRDQRVAGYLLYGSSTLMVLSLGDGVQLFVLDPATGDYVLVQRGLRIPASGKLYSVNEANFETFPAGVQAYLRECHEKGHSARYAGAMVADVHRVLLKGGVFLYPPTASAPDGKLRLMYECNPMAMLVEQAGGRAETGSGAILEVAPSKLHQRVPVFIGSADNIARIEALSRGG